MTGRPVEEVLAHDWSAAVARCREEGFPMLDLYTAVDHGGSIELVLRLSGLTTAAARVLMTSLDANLPVVASLAPSLSAARWHERELAEMFGIRFLSHPDPRPLLLRQPGAEPPLRRRVPLDRRVARDWPGADGREGRRSRPQLPPGVRADWLAGGGG